MGNNDTKLLDYLDSLDSPGKAGWQLRASSSGRGYRLLTSSREPNYPTARAAIEAAMTNGPVRL